MRIVVATSFLSAVLILLLSSGVYAQGGYDQFRMTLPWAGEVWIDSWMNNYNETRRTLEGVFDVASIPEDHALIYRDLTVVRDAVLRRAAKRKATAILLHAISPEFFASCRWEAPQLSGDPTLCLIQANPESESLRE